MRRVLVLVSIAVALVVVVLLVLGATLLNVDKFRPRIQNELQAKLGRPVALGQLHLHLFPFSIKADSLSIGESPAFPSSHPFATAQEVYASAELMSLIHGEPVINELTLAQPQIELIRNTAGEWNFSSLGKSSSKGSSSGQQSELTLNELKITDGHLALTDAHAKSPRTVYNHIDVTLTGFAPGKQFDIDVSVHLPGAGKELVAFNGKAGPLSSGVQATPVAGHLSLQEVSLAEINSVVAGAIPPNTDAVTSGEATISSENEALLCKGNLTLSNATVRGAKVNFPIETHYDLKVNQKTDQIAISSGSVKIGATAVALSGVIDNGVTPSNLNVRLQTTNASITELSRLAGLFGVAFDANDQVKGSVTADLAVTGAIKAPQIQGVLSSSSIQAQEIVLSNVRANCRMKNGVIDLAPLTAGIFGGQESGTISVDTKPAHPLCSVKTRLTGVDNNALLSAVSTVKNTIYGTLAADADLNFAVDTSANLARTLNGTFAFNLANGRLQNVNILNELSKVGKFLNSAPAQSGSGTTLQKLAGTLDIRNGLATTNNLVAVIPEAALSAAGSLNLVSQGIDLRMNAVLPNSTSKTVGGTSVGGFLNTALANNKGELVIPVIVAGNMAHPTFTPDIQAMTKMKLSHLVPTSGDPSKLASGILGSVLGGSSGKQQSNGKSNAKPGNPLNSILDGLKRK